MAPAKSKSASGNNRQSLGGLEEALAAEYLQAKGYQILKRNFRSPYGGIDLIAFQAEAESLHGGPVLVFIEVKTRSTNAFGLPEEAVTPAKQVHLIQAAQAYLQRHPDQAGNWCIDVIAVCTGQAVGPAEIKHFENAVH